MNIKIFKASARGHADYGWLKANYSFSFSSYYNPESIHFGALRVLNDDIIAGGQGFGAHGHDNMEIITIPIAGGLAHRDSMGNEEAVMAGEVQVMSAGTGVHHSEFNASKTTIANTLQIWLFPKKLNIKPRYEQKSFVEQIKPDTITTVVSADIEKDKDALWINQDAYFSIAKISAGKTIDCAVRDRSHGIYAFVMAGKVTIADNVLANRDAAGLTQLPAQVSIEAQEDSQVLLMELPMQGNW
ncbi:hypothetical protein SAMN05421780_10191 [Flexibacter flexilis DSM 6793]|uniref:Pirin N-terminal domain-containing protein n=1 Tax=Flexibacter flexilis DSM 6793 TaxID=927664 RepID=A0A1I1DCI1_9BACT|nr:pirin family protein [Flexibacter flexilis]SFB72066.1 hypothetical protein SAMN05421780_10191 [Flexibacter flexilis DSM 6793]